ncbi:MAG: DNA replication/repair protein RecF [Candidatus Zixiibacteriota bacterium]|nr:MAG: DNA replication/repair protein RecF [candidate division Zixibacteria bacterium]
MRVLDAVGTFAMVFILPEDLNLTSGSPRFHRSFMDIYLSQFSRAYLLNLMEYQRILKQRNSLLKAMKDGEKKSGAAELDAWDKSLIAAAIKIMAARQNFLREIESNVEKIVLGLSGSKEKVKIAYRPRIEKGDLDDLSTALDFFQKFRASDKKYGTTLVGPHRDTIEIMMNHKPLREFGSLGQRKTVMIAMKLAALEVMSNHLKDNAILVLDEAFAEFDRIRTKSLLDLLSGRGQVFLASADERGLSGVYDDIRVFKVDGGMVTEN